jgi:hypothetical protein
MSTRYTVDWDGEHLPGQLKQLPPGRYVLTGVDETVTLSNEEENGFRDALGAVRAGQGRSLVDVRGTLERILPR